MGSRKEGLQGSGLGCGLLEVPSAPRNNKLRPSPSSPALSLQSCFIPPSPGLQVKGGWGYLLEKSGAPRSAPEL